MAVRNIAITDTLETFRQQFNALTRDDFGDIADLDPSLAATTIIGAVNELSSVVSAGQAFFITDEASTRQQVAAGQTLTFLGTSNQIEATVSVPDTLTISLSNDVNVPNDLSVGNDLIITNQATIGTILLSGNTISVTDSTILNFGVENLTTTGTLNAGATTINGQISASQAVINGPILCTNTITGANLDLTQGGVITFEGSSNDDFETTLTVVNPTSDRTITLPNVSGTVVTTGDVGTVTSTMIANSTITNDDIANSTIRAAKLNLVSDTLIVDTIQANAITGGASVAQLVEVNSNNTTNETVFLTFVDGATGNQALETDTNLNYNPSTNVLQTTANQANYADLAERYISDEIYQPGIIVMFGGIQEITIATEKTTTVAGVISEKPAYLMNTKETDDRALPVALQGRVPCKVKGTIKKGDMIVVSDDPGVGTADSDPKLGSVIGKALENYDSQEVGIIEVVVGRL